MSNKSNNGSVSSSQQNLTPRSLEIRKTAFKVLSQTLRTPPSQDSSPQGKSTFKINKQSPRSQNSNSLSSIPPQGINKMEDNKQPNRRLSKTKFSHKPVPPSSMNPKSNAGSGDTVQAHSSMKDCHLNNVLRSARRCLHELREAKECFSNLVAEDEQLSRGIRKTNPSEDHLQLSQVANSITNLCREAFVPAHRLNQTAIALYSAEDFLRYPSDIRTFDLQTSSGRIKLPDMSFNEATLMKLREVVDLAAETYNKFNGKGRTGKELQELLFCILRGYQDFYAAALGCQEIFKVLLYTGTKDKAHLQQFLLALAPMDRSDMLVEIQDLRRILDEIVIFLEKLSWGSFVVYRLAGGHTVKPPVTPGGTPIKSSLPTYPAYPLLKAKGPKAKTKKGAKESMQPSCLRLDMKPENGQRGKAKRSRFARKKTTLIGETECLDEYELHKRSTLPATVYPDGDASLVHKKGSITSTTSNSNASFNRLEEFRNLSKF
ncbi:hypothetical protein Ocin01_09564 [Orchesella cincta]|uniref:Uncharacterized protein n=1 Tax=Orchesella cincta TaxID=48709 RepID=A0A1D2MVJ3_ORCCI|nr:hypothetical protein Ocin01_09564 [Orchesella cincta]